MGQDAVALLRVKSPKALKKSLDKVFMDSAITPLKDGSVLFSTMVGYAEEPEYHQELKLFLTQLFGRNFSEIHDDERGIFIFSDIFEPRASDYEGTIKEIGAGGFWLKGVPLSAQEIKAAEEKLSADLESFELGMNIDVEKFQSHFSDFHLGCLLIKRKKALPSDAEDTNRVHTLPDGSQFIITTDMIKTPLNENSELMALRLGGEKATWIEGHTDPRGVCLFTDNLVPEVENLTGYEDAVKALGDRAHWLHPKSMEDLMKEHQKVADDFYKAKPKRKKKLF